MITAEQAQADVWRSQEIDEQVERIINADAIDELPKLVQEYLDAKAGNRSLSSEANAIAACILRCVEDSTDRLVDELLAAESAEEDDGHQDLIADSRRADAREHNEFTQRASSLAPYL